MPLIKSPLSGPERALRSAYSRGEQVDLRTGDPQADDAEGGHSWPRQRTVRAEAISKLLRGADRLKAGATPAIRLAGARVLGQLDLSCATASAPLLLEDCWLEQPPVLTEATTRSIGIVRSWLPGFNGSFLTCHGQVNLDQSIVLGRVQLVMAQITGELTLRGTRIVNPEGWGLFAGGLKLAGGLFGGSPPRAPGTPVLTIEGGMRLVGAQLMGGVFLDRVQLRNPSGVALAGDNAFVKGRMLCQDGFSAEGTIRLPHVRIDGEASFAGAILSARQVALVLTGAEVRELDLRTSGPITGLVDLRHSHCAVLRDRPDAGPVQLALDGFAYDALGNDGDSRTDGVDARLGWLRRDAHGYRPQPYEQLAGLYRRLGNDRDARRVLLAKERRRRRSLRWPGRMLGWLLDWTVGYGYRPGRAAAWLAALLAVGTVAFSVRAPQPVGDSPPLLDPVVYTLDLLLPVSVFGVREEFLPDGSTRWLAYGLSAAGWLLATALVAGAARVFKRD